MLIKANHQTVRLLLDDREFFASGSHDPAKNPGMALFFVPLPENYAGKVLSMEVVSPIQAGQALCCWGIYRL
ncbi:hypothetical protein HSX37_06405|uniref:hypothetical protein n=1 Tax=Dendrosporobacter quercicolus TaxID=146817 RepID=UPI000B890CEB|nr:hypothetical protein [Dendrosporobacter quercicolus]NSL47672.1 hypothetical protein [Dendrosporobacter quercicolus DSM 1736]